MITRDMIKNGFENGIISIEDDYAGCIGICCKIGDNAFYFLGSEDDNITKDEYWKSYTLNMTIDMIFDILKDSESAERNGLDDWGIAVVPDGGIYDCDPNDLLAIPIIDNSSYKTQHELHQQLGPERICNAIFESVVTNLFDTNNRKGALAFLDALGMKFNVIPKKVSEFETADDEDADESSMFSEI